MHSHDDAERSRRSGLLTPRQDTKPGVSRTEFTVDRTSLQQLLDEPVLCEVPRIRGALDRANFGDAAVRALARLQLGLDVPDEVLIEILTYLEVMHVGTFIALARQVATETLIARLRQGIFGDDYLDVGRTVFVSGVVWLTRPTDETRAQLVPLLRRAARWHYIAPDACAILGWLVLQLGDVHLREIFEARHGAADSPLSQFFGEHFRNAWKAPLDALVRALAEETVDPLMRPWYEKARPPKVGPNERCPCGSGKKYKKCHVDQPELLKPVPPPRTEVISALSSWVGPEVVRGMQRDLVAALDLRRLRPETLSSVLRAYAYARDWRRARRARDEIVRRSGKAEADSHWFFVVYEAIRAGQYEVARALFNELSHPGVATDLALELELHELYEGNREVFERLERAAEVAARGDTPGAGSLARALLHKLPALGIFVTRGAQPDICDAHPDELKGLLYEVEDARNRLGLPPHDPAWAAYGLSETEEEDQGDQDPERDDRDRDRIAADLQGKLEETSRRVNELERQLAEQARLAVVERPATPAVVPMPADARQKQRIEQLEAMVRERNAERSELRRALAELNTRNASPAAPAGTRRPEGDANDDQFIAPVEPAGGRRVLVPLFGAAAEAALGDVPRDVAAATVVAVGRLAAGEVAVWRGVKQAKDMPKQVLMARIGIHHRLLFRSDEGRLEALDLVTRESLQTTLKRLRAG